MRNKIYGKETEVEFDVEPDGRRINSTRDPPGQKSVYIPPGNNYLFLSFISIFILLTRRKATEGLIQRFPTWEEFLPREEFHHFRGGI